MSEELKDYRDRIRYLLVSGRQRRGWSQAHLGRCMTRKGVAQRQISRWECGEGLGQTTMILRALTLLGYDIQRLGDPPSKLP